MESLLKPLAQDLRALAGGAAPTLHLAVRFSRSMGPRENDVYDVGWCRGRNEWFVRGLNRHTFEGGSIGNWCRPADATIVENLAQAMLASEIWRSDSEAGSSGERVSRLEWAVGGVGWATNFFSTRPSASRFSHIVDELLSLATRLSASHQGAELAVALELAEIGGAGVGLISLCNSGKDVGVIRNPLYPQADGKLGLCLNVRTLGPDPVDGYRGELVSTPKPDVRELAAPWDSPFLVLAPGATLACPVAFPLGALSVEHGYSFIATYSSPVGAASDDFAGTLYVGGFAQSQCIELYP